MKSEILHEKKEYVSIRDLVLDIGERYGDKTAYAFRTKPADKEIKRVSYREMARDVRALATEMAARGWQGRHCAVVGKLSYPWICAYYAVLSVGAVLVPLDRDWTAAELAETMKRADVDIAFFDGDLADKKEKVASLCGQEEIYSLDGEGEGSLAALLRLGAARVADGDRSFDELTPDTDRLSLLVFTSGTTGKGKGVMLSQRNILSDMADVLPFIDFTNISVGVLPPHHTYGSSVNILGHNTIGCEVYLSSGLRYIQRELKEIRPGHMVLVPLYLETFYRKIWANIRDQGKEALVRRMIRLSNFLRKLGIDLRRRFFKSVLAAFGGEVRMIVSGGAAISQEILDFYDAIGISVLNGYGITECAPIIAVNHSRRIVPGSVGFVLGIDSCKIAEPNEQGEGEIRIKGPNVMLGYYQDEEATAAAFDEEGYFRTGDYGKIENGVLYITGRLKNLIILSNGKNVYPEEIESELVAAPGVQDVVVYEGQSRRGVMYNAIVAEIYPDHEYLEKNGVADPQAHFQEIVNRYNRTATPYKKIEILRVREEEFPKNTLRKIMRFRMDMTIE